MSPRRAVTITMVALVCGGGVPVAHAQKIYCTDVFLEDSRIYRADLDGSNTELLVTLVPSGEGPDPRTLALDLLANRMYWTTTGPRSPGKIQRANLDGSNVQDVLAAGTPTAIALDPRGGKFYFADSGYAAIFQSNLD
jgi:DNA-binding beta-propeller fold protein YncE